MAYLNEAGVTALWNKLKNRDIIKASITSKADSKLIELVRDGGDTISFALNGASANAAGLMSAADKTKLDSLAIDSAFSTTSTNAIANKAVTGLLDGLYTKLDISQATSLAIGEDSYFNTAFAQNISKVQDDGSIDLIGETTWIGAIGLNSKYFTREYTSDSASTFGKFSGFGLQPKQTFTSVKVNTPAAGDSSTLCATTAFVQNAINTAMTSASAFQGTTKDYTTIANAAYKKGWYWVASAAFTLGAESIEIGDMIFCISNKGTASATTDFSVVQANLTSIPTTYIDALS